MPKMTWSNLPPWALTACRDILRTATSHRRLSCILDEVLGIITGIADLDLGRNAAIYVADCNSDGHRLLHHRTGRGGVAAADDRPLRCGGQFSRGSRGDQSLRHSADPRRGAAGNRRCASVRANGKAPQRGQDCRLHVVCQELSAIIINHSGHARKPFERGGAVHRRDLYLRSAEPRHCARQCHRQHPPATASRRCRA